VTRSPPLLPHDAWQAERRNAVTVLTRQIEQASRACNWPLEDALRTARMDVREQLRTIAGWTIGEGVHMSFVHETALLKVAA
jgi:hypothetical protein